MLIETPGLLLNGEESEYLEKMWIYYKTEKILYPEENKDVILFVSDKHTLLHILRGNKSGTREVEDRMNPYRAHRILRIKFIIEQKEIRDIYKCKKTSKYIFVSTDLKYCIVCSYQRWKDRYKVITAYFKSKLIWFNDTNRYEKIH